MSTSATSCFRSDGFLLLLLPPLVLGRPPGVEGFFGRLLPPPTDAPLVKGSSALIETLLSDGPPLVVGLSRVEGLSLVEGLSEGLFVVATDPPLANGFCDVDGPPLVAGLPLGAGAGPPLLVMGFSGVRFASSSVMEDSREFVGPPRVTGRPWDVG